MQWNFKQMLNEQMTREVILQKNNNKKTAINGV